MVEGQNTKASLDVCDLSYVPTVATNTREFLNQYLPFIDKESPVSSSLLSVNFRAVEGEITAILGPSEKERRTVVELISGRRKYGSFNGDVVLNGLEQGASFTQNVALIPRKCLYSPGLTYLEMLTYAAKLRIVGSGVEIASAVSEVIEIMELDDCKNRVIENIPSTRGELGGDLRRLSIALELVTFPKLLILDNPTLNLDPFDAARVMSCMRKIAKKGHIVVTALSEPSQDIFNMCDNIVILAHGHSVFSSNISNIKTYFCEEAKYEYKETKLSNLVDFLMDITRGYERPTDRRLAIEADELQMMFETSKYYNKPVHTLESASFHPDGSNQYYGYFEGTKNIGQSLLRTVISFQRAVYTKTRENEMKKIALAQAVGLSLVVGYLMYGNGDFGQYVMMMFNFPYTEVSNTTVAFFFVAVYSFLSPGLNVHLTCQKLQVYRYEQRAGCLFAGAFALATVLADIPWALFYNFIFTTIFYFMIAINKGYYNFWFYTAMLGLLNINGVMFCNLFAAVLRREYSTRFCMLVCVFMSVGLSGFPFQFPHDHNCIKYIAQVNPLRWAFETLMVWKFMPYVDGEGYINPYGFQEFDKFSYFPIITRFIVITLVAYILALFKPPNFLAKGHAMVDDNRQTEDSLDSVQNPMSPEKAPETPERPTLSTRPSGAVRETFSQTPKPVLFVQQNKMDDRASRESADSVEQSETLKMKPEVTNRGPQVVMRDICYGVDDSKSVYNYHHILKNVSAVFEPGKLSAILGHGGSGKSSLIHILAGDTGISTDISGTVLFDNEDIHGAAHADIPLWRKCAFVEAHDEHFRDLTVHDIVSFSVRLRNLHLTEEQIEEKISSVLLETHLAEEAKKMSKHLNPGHLRSLSIAEEIVNGCPLLLIDEPCTDMHARDEAQVMRILRNWVVREQTAVCTLHQPSKSVLNMFDHLLLLSNGQVIYHGPVNKAESFFLYSPFKIVSDYVNPADFLISLSSGVIRDKNDELLVTSKLTNYFSTSTFYSNVRRISHAEDSSDKAQQKLRAFDVSLQDNEDKRRTVSSEKNDMVLSAQEEYVPEKQEEMASSVLMPKRKTPYVVLSKYMASYQFSNWDHHFSTLSTLSYRAWLSMITRWKMIFGSFMVSTLLACYLGGIVGDISAQIYNSNSVFGFGLMLLMITNVQIAFYVHKNHQIFLKEHARGLYTNVQHWMTVSIPLYCVKCFNLMVFTLILWDLCHFIESKQSYFMLCGCVYIITATMMSEAIIYSSVTIRECYQKIPGAAFLQMFFSGIFVKPGTLPHWLGWAPSLSFIRWAFQSISISEFKDNPIFPTIEPFYFDAYSAYMSTLGWGGKTRLYCLYMLIINTVVWSLIVLVVICRGSIAQRGGRQFQKREVDEHRLFK